MLKLMLQYFWPSEVKSQLTGKDPIAGKEKKGKGLAEDEMAR